MFGPVEWHRPGMGPVIGVKRQQLVDRAPFVVGVINLRGGGIENFRSGSFRALLFWAVMAKAVAVTQRAVSRLLNEIELLVFFHEDHFLGLVRARGGFNGPGDLRMVMFNL